MKNAKVKLCFQVDNVDGKTLDDITEAVYALIEGTELDKVFRPLWESTEVFDENGKYVDGDYC